jgi:hypothetical protein
VSRRDRRTVPLLATPCLVLAGRRSSRPAAGIASLVEDTRSHIAVPVEDSRSLVAADMEDNVGRRRHRSSLQQLLVVAGSSRCHRMLVEGMRVGRLGWVERNPAAGLSNDPTTR